MNDDLHTTSTVIASGRNVGHSHGPPTGATGGDAYDYDGFTFTSPLHRTADDADLSAIYPHPINQFVVGVKNDDNNIEET